MTRLILISALAVGTFTGCTPREQTLSERDSIARLQQDTGKIMRKPLRKVLEENNHLWLEIPGVIGTGEGADAKGNPAIVIFTDRRAADVQPFLPTEKDDYPVVINEIGTVTPLDAGSVRIEVDTSQSKPKRR